MTAANTQQLYLAVHEAHSLTERAIDATETEGADVQLAVEDRLLSTIWRIEDIALQNTQNASNPTDLTEARMMMFWLTTAKVVVAHAVATYAHEEHIRSLRLARNVLDEIRQYLTDYPNGV